MYMYIPNAQWLIEQPLIQWRSWVQIDARAHIKYNYAQGPKIHLKAKKKELPALGLNHRP